MYVKKRGVRVPYIAVVSLCVLMGCDGLRPIHQRQTMAPTNGTLPLTINIAESTIPDRIKVRLRQKLAVRLQDIRLHHPCRLMLSLQSTNGDIALNPNAKILRSQSSFKAKLDFVYNNTLHHTAYLESISSYTVSDLEELQILNAEVGTNDQLLDDLVQQIVYEVLLFLEKKDSL